MSYTKGQFVEAAYTNGLGLANYVFDLSPEMIVSAVALLDSMVNSWNGIDINIQWPMSDRPDPDTDVSAFVPQSANLAIQLGLAVLLGPSIGKVVPPSVAAAAARAYDNMLSNRLQFTNEQCLPVTMPVGAGNKQWGGASSYPFFNAYRGGNGWFWGNGPQGNQ